MYKMNDGWTDERMDDFRDEVYRRFDKFEGEVDKRFDKVDREFHRVHDRLDSLYRAQFVVGGGIIAALLGVIATQI